MPATIKQVAERAGVSPATVSKYLNGIKLKEKNKNAVQAAIAELGYKSNAMARGLRTNKSMTIGAVVYDFNNLFAMNIISEIESYISAHGYGVIICESKMDVDTQNNKIKFLLDKHVDGLIIFPVRLTDSDMEHIAVPVVCIDQLSKTRLCDYVLVENASASFAATEHLIKHGHDKIGIICGPNDLYTAKERVLGYLKAHKNYCVNVCDDYIYRTDYSIESGYSAANKIIKNKNRPTALFTTNYELTLGALIALNEYGISIPDDMSFIGFDNIELANAVRPSLSVVTQPTAEMGIKAAEILLHKMAGVEDKCSIIKLPLQFINQQSVKNFCTRVLLKSQKT